MSVSSKADVSVEKASLGDVESPVLPSNNGIDPVAEKKLLRKLDWILLPMATLICQSEPWVQATSPDVVC